MSYKGTVRNGVVVLPPGAKLPEGTSVDVITEEKLTERAADMLDVEDVDPTTLLPRAGQITTESLLKGLHEGRERS